MSLANEEGKKAIYEEEVFLFVASHLSCLLNFYRVRAGVGCGKIVGEIRDEGCNMADASVGIEPSNCTLADQSIFTFPIDLSHDAIAEFWGVNHFYQ